MKTCERERKGLIVKIKILCLLMSLILLGCSKKTTESSATFKATSFPQALRNGDMPAIPYSLDVVETVDTKEVNDISSRAEILLNAKNYDGLDAFAQKLRDSRERYASGAWKLNTIYNSGLCLSNDAPDSAWTAHLTELEAWTNARPNSITARVALAYSLIQYAWKARGADWADAVTDKSWRLFYQRLNEAVKVLDGAKALPGKCPYWWNVNLITQLGLSSDRSHYDKTFEEATRAWPDYELYYSTRAYYLLPRWYGTNGEWESDLSQSADRTGGEKGDVLYAEVVWRLHSERIFTNIFKENNLSWPRVNNGFAVMEKQFPSSLAAKSEHAYLAVLARDNTVARKQFDKIHGQMDLSVWPDQVKFITFALWAYSPDHKPQGQ